MLTDQSSFTFLLLGPEGSDVSGSLTGNSVLFLQQLLEFGDTRKIIQNPERVCGIAGNALRNALETQPSDSPLLEVIQGLLEDLAKWELLLAAGDRLEDLKSIMPRIWSKATGIQNLFSAQNTPLLPTTDTEHFSKNLKAPIIIGVGVGVAVAIIIMVLLFINGQMGFGEGGVDLGPIYKLF